MPVRAKLICVVTVVAVLVPAPAPAYSVLTHEATIDALWDTSIKPLLLARFPQTTDAALDEARAYAYGGCVIHDLGYYPSGSKFFGVTQASFVFNLSRRQYEKEFGRDYARPKGFARVIGFLYHLVPKIGPFRALAFKVPTPEAEKMFLDSFARTKERYAQELGAVKGGTLAFANMNLDVGQPLPRGRYSLADETYDELLKKLTEGKNKTAVPAGLQADLVKHFGANDPRPAGLK